MTELKPAYMEKTLF